MMKGMSNIRVSAEVHFVKAIKKVQMHQGDGAETALKLWNASAQKGQPLFFLDGDHQYETVIRELRIIFRDVASANFLIHDTLYQTEESNYNIGPFLAIEDFSRRCRTDFVALMNTWDCRV